MRKSIASHAGWVLLTLAAAGCGGEGGVGVQVHDSITIDTSTTWEGNHEIVGNLDVHAPLTLEPCTEVAVGANIVIHVEDGGAILSQGRADCPVVWTSSSSSPSAGDWKRFDLWSSSSENRFEHTVIEYAGDTEWGAIWIENGARAVLSNVTFRHSGGLGMYWESGAQVQELTGLAFENVPDYLIRLGVTAAAGLGAVTTDGTGRNAIWIRNSTLSTAGTIADVGVPYEAASIEVNDVLEITENVTVRMAPDALWNVRDGGEIKAGGTSDSPVIFESNKASPAAGDWARFDVWSTSGSTNGFQNAVIRHGGSGGTYGALWVESGATITLSDVTFENNETCDVDDNGTVDGNSTYTSCP